jgi:two-component system, LytTR family, response regulator
MFQKMKTILIDDEPLACDLIQEYLADYPELEIVSICHDGFEGLKQIQKHNPELIFLDVQMPKINGFEMLELLDELPSVIFTTAFDQYAIKAFENKAIDYLLKPFSKDRFNKSVDRFLEQKKSEIELSELKQNKYAELNQSFDKIVLKDNSDIKIIALKEIVYFEAYDDYVKIHCNSKTYLKKNTLSFYENELENRGFVRIHRSYIINTEYLNNIVNKDNNTLIVLKNGEELAPSRTGLSLLKSVLNY